MLRLFSFIAPKALHAWKWEYEWESEKAPSHPACRLLRHSEIGQHSANPPNLTLETISSQSARSSAVKRDNQSTMGKQKRQSGREQQGAFKGEYEERGYQKKKEMKDWERILFGWIDYCTGMPLTGGGSSRNQGDKKLCTGKWNLTNFSVWDPPHLPVHGVRQPRKTSWILQRESPPPWQPKVINSISSNLPAQPPTPPTRHHRTVSPAW